MTEESEIRIDKFLWYVRVYKSRTVATDECRKGRVMAGDRVLRAASPIMAGMTITVRKPPVTYSYQVVALPKGRVGAALVPQYMSDITPQEEREKLEAGRMAGGYRRRGSGRPTKRERRELDDFLS